MPTLSDELFYEKWASKRFGDGDFRVRVYKILRKFGIRSERAWEMTNLIRQYAAAFSHFFDVNDTVERDETGKRVYPIWNFIEAMTYRLLSEECEAEETVPKQKSRIIERAIARMHPQQRSDIIQYTWPEDLEDVLKRFEADFPANFPIDTFFTPKAKHIREAIDTENRAIKHVENESSERPEDEKTAAYIDAVDDLKHQVLKTLAPEPLETKELLS